MYDSSTAEYDWNTAEYDSNTAEYNWNTAEYDSNTANPNPNPAANVTISTPYCRAVQTDQTYALTPYIIISYCIHFVVS